VKCLGANAPLELFINLCIFGVIIVIIESNIQLYRMICFNRCTDLLINCMTQPAYRRWAHHKNGQSPSVTSDSRVSYVMNMIYMLIVHYFSGYDFISTLMQFSMTFININKFGENNGKYECLHKSFVCCICSSHSLCLCHRIHTCANLSLLLPCSNQTTLLQAFMRLAQNVTK
jgi:hypothetical protein